MEAKIGGLKAYYFPEHKPLSDMASVLNIWKDVPGEIIQTIIVGCFYLSICVWHLAMKKHIYIINVHKKEATG